MNKRGIEIVNGVFIFGSISLYFFIMELVGLSDKSYLRFLNIIIVIYFVNRTIRQIITAGKGGYFSNFGSAIITSSIGVVLGIIGLSIYINFWKGIDYVSELSAPIIGIGVEDLTMLEYCFALFAEGLASSVVVSFIIMQYWKNRRVPKQK